MSRIGVALLLLAAATASDWPPQVRVTVSTSTGPVAGRLNGTRFETACAFFPPTKILPTPAEPDVAAFLGIPYAEKPIGQNRFLPPKPVAAWSQPLEATKVGSVCAQLPANGLIRLPVLPGTEDCLYLNVWAPTDSAGNVSVRSKPVLIFIHGGGFLGGSGFTEMNCAFYDGQGLAADIGAVVVTLNYRVGAFGWLADPALLAQSGTTGNYGLQDQRTAIKWIKRNAHVFGGDPNRISIMGQSAGAASVLHHAVLPRSQGLFSQGIAMSGYAVAWSLEEGYKRAAPIVKSLGCTDMSTRLECLQKVSTEEILKAEDSALFSVGMDMVDRMTTYGPVSDGYELPTNHSFLDALKTYPLSTPLIVGQTLNETNLFQCSNGHIKTDAQADEYLAQKARFMFPGQGFTSDSAHTILKNYTEYPTPKAAAMAMCTDMLFSCTAKHVADIFAQRGLPVYRYLLGRAPLPAVLVEDSCYGVPHTSGLLFLFSKAFPPQIRSIVVGGAENGEMAKKMVGAWGSFVHTGSPGAAWPKWGDKQTIMQFGSHANTNVTTIRAYHDQKCDQIARYIHM